jgi:hypothetical protein
MTAKPIQVRQIRTVVVTRHDQIIYRPTGKRIVEGAHNVIIEGTWVPWGCSQALQGTEGALSEAEGQPQSAADAEAAPREAGQDIRGHESRRVLILDYQPRKVLSRARTESQVHGRERPV